MLASIGITLDVSPLTVARQRRRLTTTDSRKAPRLTAVLAAVSVLLAVVAAPAAAAPAYPYCADGQSPRFSIGFAALQQELAATMGEPLECEHQQPGGSDTLQQTSTGLALYRARSNTPTFTNGSEHWALTSDGLVYWTGPSIDPPPGVELQTPPQLTAIAEQVMALRGLRAETDVQLRALDRAELRAYLQAAAADSPRQATAGESLLKLLGLLAPQADYQQIAVDFSSEHIAGFYVPQARQMYVVAIQGELGPAEQLTYAHEFTHALQDQHYDLNAVLFDASNDDRASAVRAVVEGDATLVQLLWQTENLSASDLALASGQQSGQGEEDMPLFLRIETLFTYLQGLDFVHSAYEQTGGFAGVDSLYRNLPESTEQVLHPEKYWAHEPPMEVALRDPSAALGAGWRLIDSNVLGELDVQMLLQQYGNQTAAARGAAGWGGGRWQLLEHKGRHAAVLKTVWDTERDASELYDLYSEGLRKRFAAVEPLVRTTARQALVTSETAADLRLNGREVLAVLSFDRTSAEAIAAALGWPAPVLSAAAAG